MTTFADVCCHKKSKMKYISYLHELSEELPVVSRHPRDNEVRIRRSLSQQYGKLIKNPTLHLEDIDAHDEELDSENFQWFEKLNSDNFAWYVANLEAAGKKYWPRKRYIRTFILHLFFWLFVALFMYSSKSNVTTIDSVFLWGMIITLTLSRLGLLWQLTTGAIVGVILGTLIHRSRKKNKLRSR